VLVHKTLHFIGDWHFISTIHEK